MKKQILVSSIAVLLALAGIAVARYHTKISSSIAIDPTTGIYRNEQYGIEVDYPATWRAYGTKDDAEDPDVLAFRIFVPDFDPKKSDEQQPVIGLAVWNKNATSTFEAPKRFMQRTLPNEAWEQVTINGYRATKITDATTHVALAYVFDRNDHLYTFESTMPRFFDTLLPTLKFF